MANLPIRTYLSNRPVQRIACPGAQDIYITTGGLCPPTEAGKPRAKVKGLENILAGHVTRNRKAA